MLYGRYCRFYDYVFSAIFYYVLFVDIIGSMLSEIYYINSMLHIRYYRFYDYALSETCYIQHTIYIYIYIFDIAGSMIMYYPKNTIYNMLYIRYYGFYDYVFSEIQYIYI